MTFPYNQDERLRNEMNRTPIPLFGPHFHGTAFAGAWDQVRKSYILVSMVDTAILLEFMPTAFTGGHSTQWTFFIIGGTRPMRLYESGVSDALGDRSILSCTLGAEMSPCGTDIMSYM